MRRLAWLSLLLLASAASPWLEAQDEGGGCNRISGGEELCVATHRTFTYRPIGLAFEETRTVNEEAGPPNAWKDAWLGALGPASFAMGMAGLAALTASAALPVLLHLAVRHPRARRLAWAAWVVMAGSVALFVVAAVAHGMRNDVDRILPGWGMVLVVGALAGGMALRGLPKPSAGGPMPALPTY